jgi:hypothetical protein
MRVPCAGKAAVAGLAATVLSGCGAALTGAPTPTPTLAEHYHGSPVPTSTSAGFPYTGPAEVTPSGLLPNFGPPEEFVGIDMENSLAGQIGVDAAMTPDCGTPLDASGKAPKVYRCYAHWGGVAVPFRVTITGGSGGYYTEDTKQLEGLLVASTVRTAWAVQEVNLMGVSLSCDKNLPKAQLVPFGEPTKYLCSDGTSYYSVQLNDVAPANYNEPYFSFNQIS